MSKSKGADKPHSELDNTFQRGDSGAFRSTTRGLITDKGVTVLLHPNSRRARRVAERAAQRKKERAKR